MSTSRKPVVRIVIGLAGALICCPAPATDPELDPRGLAHRGPAHHIPAGSSPDSVVEEPLPTETAGPLSLRDALALAVLKNPGLESFSWDVRVEEARALQAGKFRNPELDLRYYDLGIPRGSAEADPDDVRGRVMLNQTFELGGKRRRRVDLARVEKELAEYDFETQRNEVVARVTAEFAEVLGSQRRVDSLRGFVEFLDRTRDRVTALAESGILRNLEMHQVVRQAGLGRIELQRAESGLSIARFRLAATWASRLPLFTEVVGDLEHSRPIPPIETLLERAKSSPSLARWEAELKRSEAALALAKASRIPDLTAGAGFRWEHDLDDHDFIVDLEISLPIFDRKQGDVREARHEMAKAQAERKAAEAASSEMLAEFYYSLKESEARVSTMADEVVPAARAAFEGQATRFEEQLDNPGDLLDSRRDLARAEVQHIDALVDYHRALATLEGMLGDSLSTTD